VVVEHLSQELGLELDKEIRKLGEAQLPLPVGPEMVRDKGRLEVKLKLGRGAPAADRAPPRLPAHRALELIVAGAGKRTEKKKRKKGGKSARKCGKFDGIRP
jgi:hypothetical protein